MAPPQPQPAPTQRVQPATPTQRAQPIAAPQPAPRRRGGSGRWIVALMLILVLGAVGLVVAFPETVAQYVPGLTTPTSTPPTLILQPYSVQDLEIIVPPGVQVRDAFRQAFLQKAQQQYGPGTQINNNAPPTFIGGEPVKTGDDPRGTKYRASMQGFILVPQTP